MLEWIRIAAGNTWKWLVGRDAEHRADFAAITDSYEELAKMLKQNMVESQERVSVLEERMDRNRDRYLKIMDDLTELKLKMGELIVTEGECQKHLVTAKEMLSHAVLELADIKKRIKK